MGTRSDVRNTIENANSAVDELVSFLDFAKILGVVVAASIVCGIAFAILIELEKTSDKA